jgi:hypothetical protein
MSRDTRYALADEIVNHGTANSEYILPYGDVFTNPSRVVGISYRCSFRIAGLRAIRTESARLAMSPAHALPLCRRSWIALPPIP